IECKFLSNPTTKSEIGEVLTQILNDLNYKGETSIPIDESHAINLRIAPRHALPPHVYAHQVPFPLKNVLKFVNEEWDQTIQQIAPFIDGIHYVKQISFKSSVHIELVKKCIQHLIYYGLVFMVDIFQFSNMYTLQSKHVMIQLFRNKYMQEECLAMVVHHNNENFQTDNSHLVHDVLKLYCLMKPGITLGQIITNNQNLSSISSINPRGLVVFGLMKGFLRRVHEYPIIVHSLKTVASSPNFEVHDQQLSSHQDQSSDLMIRSSSSEQLSNKSTLDLEAMNGLADGRHSYDEICVELSVSRRELVRMLEQHKNCYTILHSS
ncbi:nitrogen permease regulator 2, partial [Acrasis kona]